MVSPPRQRTEAEVVERIKTTDSDDPLGFEIDVLLRHVSARVHIREFGSNALHLRDWEPLPLHVESVMAELGEYMPFAWSKVIDHRGLSANRSVSKTRAWVWLLGLDDLLALYEDTDYPQYGAPQLAVVCRALNLGIPDTEEVQRMMVGLPCSPGCIDGCGS
jgi:hypothetical protein